MSSILGSVGYPGPKQTYYGGKPSRPGSNLIGGAGVLFVLILIGGASLLVAVVVCAPIAVLGGWIEDRAKAKKARARHERYLQEQQEYLESKARQSAPRFPPTPPQVNLPPPAFPTPPQDTPPPPEKVIDARLCPKCGSSLVTRTNRKTRRKFSGCSTFPNCRFTKSLSS